MDTSVLPAAAAFLPYNAGVPRPGRIGSVFWVSNTLLTLIAPAYQPPGGWNLIRYTRDGNLLRTAEPLIYESFGPIAMVRK